MNISTSVETVNGKIMIRIEKVRHSTDGMVLQDCDVRHINIPNVAWEDDRILVMPDQIEGRTRGGIVLPDQVIEKEKANRGTVVDVGPGHYDPDQRSFIKQKYKAGDRIIFGRHAGIEFEDEGIKYRMLRHLDIFGLMRNKNI